MKDPSGVLAAKIPRQRIQKPSTQHTCSLCGKTNGSHAHLLVHMRSHTQEKPFACSECEKAFQTSGYLNVHMTMVHSNVKPFKCELANCGKSFAHIQNLKSHKMTHTTTTVPCPICNKQYRKWKLSAHIRRIHSADREKKFSCADCSFKTTEQRYLTEHRRKMHSGTYTTFDCPFCHKSCKGLGVFTGHLRTHTGEAPYPCTQCDKKFKSTTARRSHIKTIHENLKEFECPHCPHRFSIQSKLRRHLQVHDVNKKRYPCPVCNKLFTEQQSIKIHVQSVHVKERSFECVQCEQGFTSSAQLRAHGQVHMDKAKVRTRNFKCDSCDKQYFTHSSLRTHEETHLGKLYPCVHCEKDFTTVMYLKKHLRRTHRVENSEPKFECQLCKMPFFSKFVMEQHIKRHLGEKPFLCAQCPLKFLQRAELDKHVKARHPRQTKNSPALRPCFVLLEKLELF